MLQWLLDQWNDIKGNAKWAIVLVILGAIMTAAIALTHGLALWQQVTLLALFVLMFAWAVFMTAGYILSAGPARAIDQIQTEDLENAGKCRLAATEARRLREQLQALGDRSRAEAVDITHPYNDSLFPPSGAYKPFYKELADWQRSMARYATLVRSLVGTERGQGPGSVSKTLFTQIVEALREEENGLEWMANQLHHATHPTRPRI